MRKILIIAAILASALASSQKNSILLQGNLTYAADKEENLFNQIKTTTYSSEPMWGYQFSDHWTAGVAWSVDRVRLETTSISVGPDYTREERKNIEYSIGAFVRYMVPLTDLFSFYADLQGGYVGAENHTTDDNALGRVTQKVKGDGFKASLTPAFVVNIKKGFKLNFAFGNLRYKSVDYEQNIRSTSDFGLNFGHTFTIGISRNFQL